MGASCSAACKCTECANGEADLDARVGAMLHQKTGKSLRAASGSPRAPPTDGGGCHCKRSRCLKRYCDCFASNVTCGASCRCVECGNLGGDEKKKDEEHEDAVVGAAVEAEQRPESAVTFAMMLAAQYNLALAN